MKWLDEIAGVAQSQQRGQVLIGVLRIVGARDHVEHVVVDMLGDLPKQRVLIGSERLKKRLDHRGRRLKVEG